MFHALSAIGAYSLAPRRLIGIGGTKTLGAGLTRRRITPWIVESLESRAMLSTIAVSSTGDTGPGTLRAAIEQANLDAAQDTITFAPSVTGTITLSNALPDLSTNIVISGPGSSVLTVARSSAAGTDFRIFNVPIGAVVTISGLTITGGFVSDEGSDGNASGGGIENSGTLSMTDVTIRGNTAGNGDFGGVPGEGGGIENSGMLSIADATIMQIPPPMCRLLSLAWAKAALEAGLIIPARLRSWTPFSVATQVKEVRARSSIRRVVGHRLQLCRQHRRVFLSGRDRQFGQRDGQRLDIYWQH